MLSDGSNGLASYKRYYLSSAAFADRRGDVLNAIFGKLDETGKWVKAHPKMTPPACWPASGASMPPRWRKPTAIAPTSVGVVTASGLSEQQRIADAFFAEGCCR